MPETGSPSTPSLQIGRILTSVSRLRPLPTNVTRILKAVDEPGTTAGMVADLLALDQALTAYVLRVANSASLGYGSACSSLTTAVMRLGFKQIRALALSTVAAGPLTRRLGGYRLGNGELWQHSVATAGISRWFAQALSFPYPEEAYVAGLLHDMGKLLLDQYVLADYDKIVDTMWAAQHAGRKLHLWQVEEKLFGIDHAGVGGLMATQWGFPDNLADAIRCHNAPSLARSQQALAAIVNISNALSPSDSLGLSSLDGRMVHPVSLNILRLDVPSLERMRAIMLRALPEGGDLVSPHP